MITWVVVTWLVLCLPVAVLVGKAIARGAATPPAPPVLSSVPRPVAAAVVVHTGMPRQRASDETTVLAR